LLLVGEICNIMIEIVNDIRTSGFGPTFYLFGKPRYNQSCVGQDRLSTFGPSIRACALRLQVQGSMSWWGRPIPTNLLLNVEKSFISTTLRQLTSLQGSHQRGILSGGFKYMFMESFIHDPFHLLLYTRFVVKRSLHVNRQSPNQSIIKHGQNIDA
jgi:hypothetical protein